MASSSSSSSFFNLLCLFSLFSSISSSTITIPITHTSKTPSQNPHQKLTYLAALSLTRAKHIKNPTNSHVSTTPLYPENYGGYSISLSLGTPPQTLPFVFDTGSELVWFPCTKTYQCKSCPVLNTTSTDTFIPKISSSTKIIGCKNPKCNWIHTTDVVSRCNDCKPGKSNCSQICPPYLVIYGSGSTGGILLSETLDLSNHQIPNFAVGCSLFSTKSPSGIAGFGRGPASLPSQLRLTKFSYCLLSHRYDNTGKSSRLSLETDSKHSHRKTDGVSYTPLVKNPTKGNSAFSIYYYVGLKKITVGGKKVKIPYKYLAQGADGNGGTIVDSGSTFTFMESRVFEPFEKEFVNQTAHYKRAVDVETESGLRLCYHISGVKKIVFPKVVLGFKGGEKMTLPLENYISFVGNPGVVCLTMVTDDLGGGGADTNSGPSVILGNYQLQNFYTEFDLGNERFGFRQQTCK